MRHGIYCCVMYYYDPVPVTILVVKYFYVLKHSDCPALGWSFLMDILSRWWSLQCHWTSLWGRQYILFLSHHRSNQLHKLQEQGNDHRRELCKIQFKDIKKIKIKTNVTHIFRSNNVKIGITFPTLHDRTYRSQRWKCYRIQMSSCSQDMFYKVQEHLNTPLFRISHICQSLYSFEFQVHTLQQEYLSVEGPPPACS